MVMQREREIEGDGTEEEGGGGAGRGRERRQKYAHQLGCDWKQTMSESINSCVSIAFVTSRVYIPEPSVAGGKVVSLASYATGKAWKRVVFH